MAPSKWKIAKIVEPTSDDMGKDLLLAFRERCTCCFALNPNLKIAVGGFDCEWYVHGLDPDIKVDVVYWCNIGEIPIEMPTEVHCF